MTCRNSRKASADAPRASTDFFAMLSHRLRSPLAAVSAWAAVLKSGASDARVARASAIIDANARRQGELIGVCVDAMRVLLSDTAQRTHVSMASVIVAAADASHGRDGTREVAVAWDGSDERYWVFGDRKRLELLVSQLLACAVEAVGDAAGDVEVSVRRALPWIVLELETTTPAEATSSVQSRRALMAEAHGDAADLRLGIVERLVHLHEGRFERSLRSSDTGEIVHRYTVRLPAAEGLPV